MLYRLVIFFFKYTEYIYSSIYIFYQFYNSAYEIPNAPVSSSFILSYFTFIWTMICLNALLLPGIHRGLYGFYLKRTWSQILFSFHWSVCFLLPRQAIESFAVTVKDIAQMLQGFGTELAETELCDEGKAIEFLLESHTDKYRKLKARFKKNSDVIHLLLHQ